MCKRLILALKKRKVGSKRTKMQQEDEESDLSFDHQDNPSDDQEILDVQVMPLYS